MELKTDMTMFGDNTANTISSKDVRGNQENVEDIFDVVIGARLIVNERLLRAYRASSAGRIRSQPLSVCESVRIYATNLYFLSLLDF